MSKSKAMITHNGNSGVSKDTAIKFIGVTNEMEGVNEEYKYLESKFGKKGVDWKLDDQALMKDGNTSFDLIQVTLSGGEKKSVYFDITNFLGLGMSQ